MKTIKDTDPKKTKKKSTGTTYPATKETPNQGESLVLKKGQSVETWGGNPPSAPKPVKKTTTPGTTYPATRGNAPAAVQYPKKKNADGGVVHYKEGGKMMKTIKKKPTHSVMPMTPTEQKEFNEMMWRKKNEISSSAPVGGEAQRSKYEERFARIRDRFEAGGKLRKASRAYRHGGKMKK